MASEVIERLLVKFDADNAKIWLREVNVELTAIRDEMLDKVFPYKNISVKELQRREGTRCHCIVEDDVVTGFA